MEPTKIKEMLLQFCNTNNSYAFEPTGNDNPHRSLRFNGGQCIGKLDDQELNFKLNKTSDMKQTKEHYSILLSYTCNNDKKIKFEITCSYNISSGVKIYILALKQKKSKTYLFKLNADIRTESEA